MKKLLLFVVVFFILSSCQRQIGFDQFYQQNKRYANIALTIPKWLVMPFIPREEKEVIRDLARGMSRVRVMVKSDERNNALWANFKKLTQQSEYANYVYVKTDDTKVELYVRESDKYIHEILVGYTEEEEAVLVAIQGRMTKSDFQERLSRVIRDAE